MRAPAVFLINLLRLLFWPALWLLQVRPARRGRWVRLRLHHRISQLPSPAPWWRSLVARRMTELPTPLSEVRRLADALAHDSRKDGLLVELPRLSAGWATCQDLRDVLLGLRRAGKRVAVHLPEGAGHREMFVASAADTLHLTPGAPVHLLGVSAQTPYLGGLLEQIGLRAQVAAVGDFKTAGERFERRKMSDAQREQLGALLSTVQERLADAIAERPLRVDPAQVFERGLWPSVDAVEAGLVDGLCYADELPGKLGADGPGAIVASATYLRGATFELLRPWRVPPYIAVVPIHGAIAMDAGLLQRGGTLLAPTLARLRAARRDPRAVGVLLDIDSPGGSALASDLIHHEVLRLSGDKPVVARFGEVAASGGYYIGVGARRIVAQPLAVTGSIGVISGKLVGADLLARLGVSMETVRLSPHADMYGVARPWDGDERALLERELQAVYRAFLDVVARGRGRTVEEVEGWAGGRVWSGARALQLGLVDRHGGFDAAVDEVRGLLPGLPERVRARLRPRIVRAPPGPLAPPEPAPPVEAGALGPHWPALRLLLGSEERALCLALDLPELG